MEKASLEESALSGVASGRNEPEEEPARQSRDVPYPHCAQPHFALADCWSAGVGSVSKMLLG